MQGIPTPTPDSIGAQPYDPDLAALAALATTGLIDRTGAGTATTRTTGTTGLNVLAAADEATARTAIGAMANTAPVIITNANGTAYRWPNGLQICTWNEAIARTTSTNWGFLFISEIIPATFPAVFSELPTVIGVPRSLAVDGNTGAWVDPSVLTTSSVSLMGVSGFNFVKVRLGYFAIGRYTP